MHLLHLYWGHVQNIADGDNTRYSCMWIRNSAKEGDYVAVELNEVTKVNSITFALPSGPKHPIRMVI